MIEESIEEEWRSFPLAVSKVGFAEILLKVEESLALASFDRGPFWLKPPVPPLFPAGRP
jgi:hypothetical protein